MIRTSEIKSKEIINIYDGKRLGLVSDVEINMETGEIEAIIIPYAKRIRGLFYKETDTVILWSNIKKIGIDVIIVDLPI